MKRNKGNSENAAVPNSAPGTNHQTSGIKTKAIAEIGIPTSR
jgi:hypothetical protein